MRLTFLRAPAVRAFCLLAALIGAAGPALTEEPGGRRPITVEDMLATEFIGRAAFSPDGQWLVYSLVPPYDTLSDYSYWMRAGGLSGHRIWIRNMTGAGEPRLQPGLDPGASNFLFGLSPDSRWLVALEHFRGKLRLVACRIGQDACVRFDPMPDIRDRYVAAMQWNERLVWISGHEFIIPVRKAGPPGSEMRSRAASGAFLWEAWNAAWSGTRVTASEAISTGRTRAGDAPDGDLEIFDLAAGTSRTLAAGRYAGPVLSPDRTRLLAARVAERERPPAGARLVARETHPMFDRRYTLALICLPDGAPESPGGPFSIDPGSFAWRADSGAFAVYGWEENEPPEHGRFYIFDREGRLLQTAGQEALRFTGSLVLPEARWWPGPARPALLDEGLALHAVPKAGGPPGWFLVRPDGSVDLLSGAVAMPDPEQIGEDSDGIFVLSGGAAYRLSPGAAPVLLTRDGAAPTRRLDGPPYSPHAWSGEAYPAARLTRPETGSPALLVAGDPSSGDIEVFIADGSSRSALQTGRPGGRVLAASMAAGALLATFRQGASTRLDLIRPGDRPETLVRINPHLDKVQRPQALQVSYTLHGAGPAEERSVSACLLLPPDFDPARRYPLAMEIYPAGSGGDCRTLTDQPAIAPLAGDLWAARGFIYVRPALPLDLARTPDDPLGHLGALVDQTILALAAEGHADPARIVIFGFSQGGAASLVAASQARRPAAVISLNGWADYFSHYFGARGLMRYFHLDQNGGDNRWRYECTGNGPEHGCPFGFGRTALTDPGLYARASPVARAADITAPVMLVHSDFDYFDMAQYDEMFGALYRAGKEARYVRYWGEGHGPSSPANIKDLWRRIDAFLEEHGISPPD